MITFCDADNKDWGSLASVNNAMGTRSVLDYLAWAGAPAHPDKLQCSFADGSARTFNGFPGGNGGYEPYWSRFHLATYEYDND